jgi:1,4-alpha-glucan branching enzyme
VDTLITPAWRFLGYAQNHDQIGNRAAGDRLTATLSPDELAIAAVLVLTAEGKSILFCREREKSRRRRSDRKKPQKTATGNPRFLRESGHLHRRSVYRRA